jgi:hypothetical protein
MKAKAVRLLMLMAVCAAALWYPSTSMADLDICPPGFGCAHWESVCQSNGGTFTLTYVGPCEIDESTLANLWYAECTYSWREPWTLYCAS